MAELETNAGTGWFSLRSVGVPPPWEAYIIPVSGFPIPEPELGPIATWVDRLSTKCLAGREWSIEVFLQFNALHHGDAAIRLSDHGREWGPTLGLGVWPDRDPPSLWSKEEFENLDIGEMPRPMSYKVFRIGRTGSARQIARSTMIGLGAVLQVLIPGDGAKWLELTNAYLLHPITERSFRSFPFYTPLLERKSLEGKSTRQLDQWLCGAVNYIRESTEDNGILLLSREPLAPAIEELCGCRNKNDEAEWLIPCGG